MMTLTVRDKEGLMFRVTCVDGRLREEGNYVHPLTNPEYAKLVLPMSDPAKPTWVGREDGDAWVWALAEQLRGNGYYWAELEGEPDFLQAADGVAP